VRCTEEQCNEMNGIRIVFRQQSSLALRCTAERCNEIDQCPVVRFICFNPGLERLVFSGIEEGVEQLRQPKTNNSPSIALQKCRNYIHILRAAEYELRD
jgi:hypothetical protein